MFNLAGGSFTGPYHKLKKLPNQDKWNFIQEDNMIIIAVADGAGSLKNSACGAELALTTAINFLQINKDILNLSIEELVKEAIIQASEKLKEQIDADQLGCTFSIGLINDEEYCLGIVGDAFGIVKEYDNEYLLIRPEQEGEYSNITKLLTSKTFPIEVKKGNIEDLEFMAVASDGMDLSSLDSGQSPTFGFWNKLKEWGKEKNFNIKEFLEFLNTKEKIDDDTTLVMAVNIEENNDAVDIDIC